MPIASQLPLGIEAQGQVNLTLQSFSDQYPDVVKEIKEVVHRRRPLVSHKDEYSFSCKWELHEPLYNRTNGLRMWNGRQTKSDPMAIQSDRAGRVTYHVKVEVTTTDTFGGKTRLKKDVYLPAPPIEVLSEVNKLPEMNYPDQIDASMLDKRHYGNNGFHLSKKVNRKKFVVK